MFSPSFHVDMEAATLERSRVGDICDRECIMEWGAIVETKHFSICITEKRDERRQHFSEVGPRQCEPVVAILVGRTQTRVDALVHDGCVGDIDWQHDRLQWVTDHYLCCFGCICGKEGRGHSNRS
jgi:hypothetical protein